ncbi:hypothetical protein [Bdellovibrio sp. HCB288]|uniref:hypothetical protein n=1 Tax=Bdellovibrio sp. HCB288 TaxID=3394355 RepID=UPI0039B55396
MMNVSGKSLLLIMLSAAFLSGCKDPEVAVSTLGRKLAAPVLSSSSPFDQDMEEQGYVRISGSCDTRVGPVVIGFTEDSFHSPPTSPNTSGTSLGSITNDSDCSDGSFDIYLTSADLLSIWGIDATDDNDDVEHILIKGETWFGDTRTLTITNNRTPGSGNTIATHVTLRKVFPADFAGAGQCEMFNAYATDSNGNETSTNTAVTFAVQDSRSSGINYYLNGTDCTNSTQSVSSLSIPAKQGMITFYARMPTSPVDSIIGFTPVIMSGGLQAAAATNVTLRDPASNRRFIALIDAPGTIYKNVCQPITLQRMTYSKNSAYETASLTVDVAPSDAKLEFFTENDCNASSKTSSIVFGPSISNATTYIKYNYSGASSNNQVKVNLNYTVSDVNYDNPAYVVRVDLSNDTVVAKIDLGGPSNISRSQCAMYKVNLANSSWTAVPADQTYIVSVTSTNTMAGLQLYEDATCINSVSSLTIPQGQLNKTFYVKSTAAQNSSTQVTVSTSSLTSTPRGISVSVEAMYYVHNLAVSNSPLRDTCSWMTLSYLDAYNVQIPASTPIQLSFYTTSAGANGKVQFYTDASCLNPYQENTVFTVNPYGTFDYKLYMKVDGSYTDTMLNLTLNTSGALFTAPPFNFYFNLPIP